MTVEFIEWTLFAAARSVVYGPQRHFAATQQTVPFGGIVLQNSFLESVCANFCKGARVFARKLCRGFHINSLISNWLPFQARYKASYRRTALFSSCAGQRFGPCIIDTVAVGTARVGQVFTEHMASTLPDVSTAKMTAN